jgi:hypothetical protein
MEFLCYQLHNDNLEVEELINLITICEKID